MFMYLAKEIVHSIIYQIDETFYSLAEIEDDARARSTSFRTIRLSSPGFFRIYYRQMCKSRATSVTYARARAIVISVFTY